MTEEIVHNELLYMNVNKPCGPDEIHPRLLKELVATISKPIASLFNKPMKYGKVPLDWKKANVSPNLQKRCAKSSGKLSSSLPNFYNLQHNGEIGERSVDK